MSIRNPSYPMAVAIGTEGKDYGRVHTLPNVRLTVARKSHPPLAQTVP